MSTVTSVIRTDPATFEVIKNSLYSIAEEMKVVLAKTAYSPILKVAGFAHPSRLHARCGKSGDRSLGR